MSADLVAFLKARLGADEQAALIATASSEDGVYDARAWRVADNEVIGDDGSEDGIPVARARWDDPGVLEHIARHDPARVLADVAAKRELLGVLDDHAVNGEEQTRWLAATTLKMLAVAYVSHPEFRAEWADL